MLKMSILVLVTVWALPAAQADSFPGAIHARGNRATALHNTLLAVSLARYARAHDDAGAMVVAARILKGVRIEARDAHGHAVPTAIPRGLRVTSLLAEARAMPRGRELLRREVDTFQVIEHKGVLSSDYGTGLVSYGRALEAGETWQFEVVTEAQRSVTIAAIGDGDADIDPRRPEEPGHDGCLGIARCCSPRDCSDPCACRPRRRRADPRPRDLASVPETGGVE